MELDQRAHPWCRLGSANKRSYIQKRHLAECNMLKFELDRIVILSTAMKSNKDVVFTTLFW